MTPSLPHVLVVDDDPAVRELLSRYLSANEFRVSAVASGVEMRHVIAESTPDLVILDLRLIGEDGMQLARELRETSDVPLIIVSGKLDEADRVMGLEIASDDYVTKPFSNRELLARIRAVLRRYPGRAAATSEPEQAPPEAKLRAYRFSGWELNVPRRRLTAPSGESIGLSNGEFNLLLAMCETPQRALTRDQLLELSRLHGSEVYDRSIDVQVLRLRRKIEVDPSTPEFIRTERGVGYMFNAHVEALMGH